MDGLAAAGCVCGRVCQGGLSSGLCRSERCGCGQEAATAESRLRQWRLPCWLRGTERRCSNPQVVLGWSIPLGLEPLAGPCPILLLNRALFELRLSSHPFRKLPTIRCPQSRRGLKPDLTDHLAADVASALLGLRRPHDRGHLFDEQFVDRAEDQTNLLAAVLEPCLSCSSQDGRHDRRSQSCSPRHSRRELIRGGAQSPDVTVHQFLPQC